MNNKEHIRLLKENAWLRLGYEKYKRRYRLLHRFIQRKLYFHTDGLQVRYTTLLFRRHVTDDQNQKDLLTFEIEFLKKEHAELRRLYDILMEIDR